LLNQSLERLFALRAQADKMSAIRNLLSHGASLRGSEMFIRSALYGARNKPPPPKRILFLASLSNHPAKEKRREYMKRLLLIAALASVLNIAPACLAQSPAAKAPSTPSAESTKSAQVDALLAQFNQGNTPGVAVLVIQDGKTVHHKGYGFARLDTKEPIGPDTSFDLASVSKQFTAMAVMILAERNKLSYDDPLSKFFPEFPAYAQKVTIRNLLTHTSGLVDVIDDKWFRKGYEPSSKEVAGFVAKELNLKSAPGEKFEYSNTGYLLLAVIVQKASGQPFATFMRDNVFKPLGMSHSLIWDEGKPKIEHLAISYAPAEGSFQSLDPVSDTFIYGAKGVITTTEDLIKWNEALESEKLVKAATLQQAFTPMKLNDGTESPYGFGWRLGRDNGLVMVGHSGGYLGYRTHIRRYPSQRTTIVVLSNNAAAGGENLANGIGRIYLGDKMVAPAPKIKVDPAVLNSYVGKYESESPNMPGATFDITIENGELFITFPPRPRTQLLAQTPTEYLVSGTRATIVTFTKDEQDKVKGLSVKTPNGSVSARRVGP
jgi:D-alanyl-D-alanine carboxypeptidase